MSGPKLAHHCQRRKYDLPRAIWGPICRLDHYWPGFTGLHDKVFIAGCYNASGVARGTRMGRLRVDKAMHEPSPLLETTMAITKPTRIPPRPFFDIGMWGRMRLDRYAGKNERLKTERVRTAIETSRSKKRSKNFPVLLSAKVLSPHTALGFAIDICVRYSPTKENTSLLLITALFAGDASL